MEKKCGPLEFKIVEKERKSQVFEGISLQDDVTHMQLLYWFCKVLLMCPIEIEACQDCLYGNFWYFDSYLFCVISKKVIILSKKV